MIIYKDILSGESLREHRDLSRLSRRRGENGERRKKEESVKDKKEKKKQSIGKKEKKGGGGSRRLCARRLFLSFVAPLLDNFIFESFAPRCIEIDAMWLVFSRIENEILRRRREPARFFFTVRERQKGADSRSERQRQKCSRPFLLLLPPLFSLPLSTYTQ